ncbi:DUF853 family protein [Halogeometricum sp. CBA1124]|uniref:DUF853 family protein n=1 Tax=Halogeometricum sp. CBA1124 TaxID=2668071 RepID=UPI00142BBB64|nr:DUF853 family protein [Halogeometricum sp. CBA1124]MUV56094.1 DUF853 family protein [Halogeometricum sp. CBA1124]
MGLDTVPVGVTSVEPLTTFLWSTDHAATVEITELDEDRFLVRAGKSYRLLKQGEEGRETWSRNLGQLNDYLESTFSSFQISVDYTATVDIQQTEIVEDAEQLADETRQILEQKQQLEKQIQGLQRSNQISLEQFDDLIDHRLTERQEKLQELDLELQQLREQVRRQNEVKQLWQENGVSLAYLFTFYSTARTTRKSNLESAVENTLEEVYNDHRRKVKQILTGERFRLKTQELEEPRLFHRLQYTGLLHPGSVDAELPDSVVETVLTQFEAYSLRDLETSDGTMQERRNNTPARAVQSILHDLETQQNLVSGEIPSNGPMIGTINDTQQVVGFDPADFQSHGMPHMYIVGGTGSGKTVLKRVLIENCASLGYNVLSITPGNGDFEGIGISFPNPASENSQGLAANQYLFSETRLLDKPEDLTELFTGLNQVTLDTIPAKEKIEFVEDVFTELDQLGKLSRPLFVFLDEAHNFSDTRAAEMIEKLSREGRKFGVHVILVTQNPTDFSYSEATLRQQLPHLFMKGRYTDYADKFLSKGSQKVTSLSKGQVILGDWDYPEIVVDGREPLTLVDMPADRQIDRLDQSLNAERPTLDQENSVQQRDTETEPGIELSEDEKELVQFVENYVRENDQSATASKCHREGPGTAGRVSDQLQNLVEKGVLQSEDVVRGGHETTGYYK